MPSQPERVAEQREQPRLSVPPMYTLLRVRPKGCDRYRMIGHIYDVSSTGMRIELDQPLEPGSRIELRAMLPGHVHTAFNATARVVRLHDDDHLPGPARLGVRFERFARPDDRHRLMNYLAESGLRQAA